MMLKSIFFPDPNITCSSSTTKNERDEEETSDLRIMTTIEQSMYMISFLDHSFFYTSNLKHFILSL